MSTRGIRLAAPRRGGTRTGAGNHVTAKPVLDVPCLGEELLDLLDYLIYLSVRDGGDQFPVLVQTFVTQIRRPVECGRTRRVMSDPHLQVRFRRSSMSLVPIPDCHIRSGQKGQDFVTVLTPRLLEIARSAVAYKKSYPPIRRPTSQPRDPPSTAKPNRDRQRYVRMTARNLLIRSAAVPSIMIPSADRAFYGRWEP